MTCGPACERCGTCSREDGTDWWRPPKCPFCCRFKQRGSRAELIDVLHKAQCTIAMCAGFISGNSVASKESVQEEIRKTFKLIEDV